MTIFQWVGEVVLGTSTPAIATEVGFLKAEDGKLPRGPDRHGPGEPGSRLQERLPGAPWRFKPSTSPVGVWVKSLET